MLKCICPKGSHWTDAVLYVRYVLTTILQNIVLQNSIEFGLVLPLSAECTHEFLYHSQKRGDTITVHDWFWLLNNVNTELQWEKLKKRSLLLQQEEQAALLHFCSPLRQPRPLCLSDINALFFYNDFLPILFQQFFIGIDICLQIELWVSTFHHQRV